VRRQGGKGQPRLRGGRASRLARRAGSPMAERCCSEAVDERILFFYQKRIRDFRELLGWSTALFFFATLVHCTSARRVRTGGAGPDNTAARCGSWESRSCDARSDRTAVGKEHARPRVGPWSKLERKVGERKKKVSVAPTTQQQSDKNDPVPPACAGPCGGESDVEIILGGQLKLSGAPLHDPFLDGIASRVGVFVWVL
jgi:hypothetical protein